MSILNPLLQMCAMDRFFVDSDALRLNGELVYPPAMVQEMAEAIQVGVPHLKFEIRCEEQ